MTGRTQHRAVSRPIPLLVLALMGQLQVLPVRCPLLIEGMRAISVEQLHRIRHPTHLTDIPDLLQAFQAHRLPDRVRRIQPTINRHIRRLPDVLDTNTAPSPLSRPAPAAPHRASRGRPDTPPTTDTA